jgi:glutathione synthase/RimK-type ligase-like ATP-grasp enzyme
MILIITSKQDGHVGPVARHLDAANISWVRLNTEDFATNVEITAIPALNTGTLSIRDSGKKIDLQSVTAVWYRKPDPVTVTHFSADPGALDYIQAELNEILMGLYALLSHAYWINNPFTTRMAHRKMLQLHVADKVGLRTPQTLVTNNIGEALAFANDLGGTLAVKSLGAISVVEHHGDGALQYGIFTRKLSIADLTRVKDKIRNMPTLFQEFIEKAYELRITTVGRQVFSCRIDHHDNDITADDYRFDTKNLTHRAWECPEIHTALLAYMDAFQLNFGCFDILITKTGAAVFLECNPNGQWLWVENMTGQPIAEAIAHELISAHDSVLPPETSAGRSNFGWMFGQVSNGPVSR